ncbi:MAG: polysaccharide deacetylase [Acidimicrobiales bacterium]|nr:polysaccharide deacetylase [Acidimicrobiales bacterium]
MLRVLSAKTRRSVSALLAGLALAAGCSSGKGGRSAGDPTSTTTTTTTVPQIAVQVDAPAVPGGHRSVHVGRGSTVAQVLAAAKVLPAPGRLLAAGTHRVIGPAAPGRLTIGGRAVTPSTVVSTPTTLVVTNGADAVEPTVTAREATPPPGRPRALQYVYSAGRPGRADITRGKTSGEVVSQHVIDPGALSVRNHGKVVALTFDDGPSAGFTRQVLDILKAKGVHATFCLVGQQVRARPELVRQEVAEGHRICNHTFSHDEHLATAPAATIDAQVSGGIKAITDTGQPPPEMYRPPAGSLSAAVYAGVAAHHEQVVFWSNDPLDWKKPPADQIVLRVVAGLRPGGIILLHDGGGNRANTVAALPVIIDKIREAGYTFTFPIEA